MEQLEICQASAQDFEAIVQFYRDVCAEMEGVVHSAQWSFGLYPTLADLQSHLRQGNFWLGKQEDTIVAALALTFEPVDGYEACDWYVQTGKIGILHLFAVKSSHRGMHLGRWFLQSVIDASGIDALHLDCIMENDTAISMYRAFGMLDHGPVPIYYPDTGWQNYRLFEWYRQ